MQSMAIIYIAGYGGSSRESSRSSSPRSSGSSNSDHYRDGPFPVSEYTSYPSHCPETYLQRGRGRSLDRIHGNKYTLGPDRYRPDLGLPRSLSPQRSNNIQRRYWGPLPLDWGTYSRDGNKPHPHNYRRLSLSPSPCLEDRTHHPAPDHRPLLHHYFVGGYGGHSPTGRPQIFSPKPFRRIIPKWAAAYPTANNFMMGDGDHSFKPGKGDVIIVQPYQRGRMPNRCNPRQHQGCVRSYSGRDADFLFRNGDLVVRIGSHISTLLGGISYVPYRVLELYKKHDGVWKFIGDARTEEDLGTKRRNTCIEVQHSGGIAVGENCPIEPNYGDVIIFYDRILKCGDHEEHASKPRVIEWWTQCLLEQLHMVYPHNMILLRPYVRNRGFIQARELWLGRRVTRINKARKGKVEEGIVVEIWPESLIGPCPSHKEEAIEVLGNDRVGVRVRNWRRKGIVTWPLSDTFLECADQPLSTYHREDEPKRFRDAPWGSIEMYIYSKDPPAGWVYWGSSQHTL
ncbi:unnamed protein product [Calypogeia fissa]